MAHTIRLLQQFRSSNVSPPSRFSFSGRYDRLHTLTKRVEAPSSSIDRLYALTKSVEAPSSIRRLLSSNLKSYVQRFVHKSSFSNSGREFSMARLCGMSIVVGSVGFLPRYSSSMDVYDTSREDHRMKYAASDYDESPPAFLILVKKLLAPIVLLYIVWTNWGHPAIIGAKTILILLSTKPSPLSVYVLIDKWQRQFKDQHPLLHKLKSLYAKKVEVEDYTVLCLARVELDDKRYTLIGILGGWWAFERTSLEGTFSSFKKRATEILNTAVLL